jgi:hypothetical protein
MMPPPGESKPIAQVADEYRRRGYDVEVEPKGPGLPDFLEGFQPDLIARRSGDSVVVEVKVGTRTSVAERLRDIAERVNRQPGWRFALVYVNPEQPDQATDAEPAPLPVLRERVQNAEALLRGGQREAAFLLLWSALEGVLRVLGVRALLPLSNLPPSTLFRELYSAGEIGREQFDTLMRLLPLRNQLVHGFGPRAEVEVEKLHRLTTSLLAEAA